eukprot:6184575-Pleurochrysis_carterae.AAC.1
MPWDQSWLNVELKLNIDLAAVAEVNNLRLLAAPSERDGFLLRIAFASLDALCDSEALSRGGGPHAGPPGGLASEREKRGHHEGPNDESVVHGARDEVARELVERGRSREEEAAKCNGHDGAGEVDRVARLVHGAAHSLARAVALVPKLAHAHQQEHVVVDRLRQRVA